MISRMSRGTNRLIRELWKERVVTVFFIASAVFVVARTALLSFHQFFPSGARIGDVIFELAIAYIGAWIFNLLVVVLPRIRSRDRVLGTVGRLLDRLSAVGLRIPATMARGAGREHPSEQIPSEQWLRLTGQVLSFTGEAPLYVPGGSAIRPATWQEWIGITAKQVDSVNTSLVPYLYFLEIDLVDLINKVALSNFVVQAHEYASLPRVVNGDMSIFASPLRDFIEACAQLREYRLNNA
jgi:hypothetical protein